MSAQADVLIVGSGPAGVSAAWPLVQAGLKVIMLDQGREGSGPPLPDDALMSVRLNDEGQWRYFIGEDFHGLAARKRETPKMKVPGFRFVLEGFEQAYSIRATGMLTTGSLAKGGTSRMWGAGAYPYTTIDLKGFPFGLEDLDESYQSVMARIGISGCGNDDLALSLGALYPLQPPLAMHENAKRLLERYEAKRCAGSLAGIRLGVARNAVLTRDLADRKACSLTNMCLWGCPRNSIYSADQELSALTRTGNFQYIDHAFVQDISSGYEGLCAHCTDICGDHRQTLNFTAKTIILAAGAIGSTILALKTLRHFSQSVPLICHPALALAMCIPERIGRPLAESNFALGQLAYQVEDFEQAENFSFGVIFTAEGLPVSSLAAYMPFTRPCSFSLAQALMPSMLIANCYFPGSFSACHIEVTPQGQVLVGGGYSSDFEARARKTNRRVQHFFRSLGAFPLPGSLQRATLGSDGHFAGSFPMRKFPSVGETSIDGEVHGMPGLFIADGAVLPHLSAKHPTLTIMANADRISKSIAKRMLGT